MQQNNEINGMAVMIAFIVAGMFILAKVVFAILLFLAVIMTAWSLWAWRTPRTIFGETTTPEEAHAFVRRGLIGLVVAPAFAAFVAPIVGIPIRDDWWGYIALAGYAIGAVGIGLQLELAKQEAAKQEAAMRALLPPEPPARPVRTVDAASSVAPDRHERDEAEPFRFASWDDEEELRR